MAKKFLMWATSLCIAVSFLVNWRLTDKLYPSNDEGFYLILSQEIYSTVKDTGIFEGLKLAYLHKHWKPILHPVIGSLFLAVTSGDVRVAITLYDVLMYGLLLTMVFLYLKKSANWLGTVVGVNVVAFLPWLFGSFTSFTSEVGFLTATLGLLYTTDGKTRFEDIKTAVYASIWLTLMFCFRPVETTLIFAIPILIFVIRCFVSGNVVKLDLALLAFWILLFVSVITVPYFVLKREWTQPALFLIFLISAAYALFCKNIIKKHSLNRAFHGFFSIFFFVSTVWYAAGAYTLFDWIFLANFQALAIHTGNRFGRPLSVFYSFYLEKLGMTLWVLLVFCLLNFRQNLTKLKSVSAISFIAGSLLIPLVAGSMSYNGDVRYYYAGWLVAIVVLLRLVLAKEGSWFKTRILITGLGALALIFHIVNINYRFSRFLEHQNFWVGGSFFTTQFSENENRKEIFNQINRFVDPDKTSTRFFLLTRPHPAFTMDPFNLQVTANELNKYWKIDSRELFFPDSREQTLEKLINYDYVLSGPAVAEWTSETTALEKLANDFHLMCSNPAAEIPQDLKDFKLAGQISIEEDSTPFSYCLFANTIKKNSHEKRFH